MFNAIASVLHTKGVMHFSIHDEYSGEVYHLSKTKCVLMYYPAKKN